MLETSRFLSAIAPFMPLFREIPPVTSIQSQANQLAGFRAVPDGFTYTPVMPVFTQSETTGERTREESLELKRVAFTCDHLKRIDIEGQTSDHLTFCMLPGLLTAAFLPMNRLVEHCGG